MPSVIVAGCTEVQMFAQQDNIPVENVWHFSGVGGSSADQVAFGDALTLWITDSLATNMAANVQVNGLRITDLSSSSGAQTDYTTGYPFDGSAGGTAHPNNVTVAIAHRTGLRGRSFRGRSFHIGLTSSQAADNQVNAGFITDITTNCYDQLIGGSGVGGANLVVMSRKLLIMTEVTLNTVNIFVDSMRKRLPDH